MASRAAPDCPETLAAAKRLLEDQMGTVRESAIKAIAALVPKGSREAIDWISPRLDDWHESVRRAAVVAVAKIAEKGDQHAIELEKSACDDRSWIVRKAATDSLAATATLNDLPSLRKLAKMLEDFDPLPRMAAIYGMAELCGVGHRKAQASAALLFCTRLVPLATTTTTATTATTALISLVFVGVRRCYKHSIATTVLRFVAKACMSRWRTVVANATNSPSFCACRTCTSCGDQLSFLVLRFVSMSMCACAICMRGLDLGSQGSTQASLEEH
ncbi:DSPTP1 [Symbiodinium sp. CCMP2456]|nr:DSPTP1 [Symbiodinium sp. CCMP2456]